LQGIKGRNVEEFFVGTLEGAFDALHIPEVQDKAEAFVRKLVQAVFEEDIRQSHLREVGVRRTPSSLLTCYLDAIPHAMAREQPDHAKKARAVITQIVEGLVSMKMRANVTYQDIMLILDLIAHRFTALCLDDSWTRKSAGCSGIKIMSTTPEMGAKWIKDQEVDLVRTLLHILKDLPSASLAMSMT
jgi:transformation/transcription domain-associated protein